MKKHTNFNQTQNATGIGLGSRIISMQKKLAHCLNLKCRHLSSKGLLVLLITFTLVVSALLLRLIINAIQ